MLIEKVVLDHLKSKLNSNDVYLETPEVAPAEFVEFRIDDREKLERIDSVVFELYSEADSKLAAATLDKRVRDAMESLVEGDSISRSKLSGGRDEMDNALKKYRYVSYYNVIYYDD